MLSPLRRPPATLPHLVVVEHDASSAGAGTPHSLDTIAPDKPGIATVKASYTIENYHPERPKAILIVGSL